jgi:hypothetical protein
VFFATSLQNRDKIEQFPCSIAKLGYVYRAARELLAQLYLGFQVGTAATPFCKLPK